jgi:hypothetical protein
MSASNSNSIGDGTVYHPLGAIRLISPAEEQAAGSTTSHGSFIDILRRFARVYVASQQHRNGF